MPHFPAHVKNDSILPKADNENVLQLIRLSRCRPETNMIHEYETGFELLAINMFKMNLSHHVQVVLCLGSVLFIFWIGQIFVQNITFFSGFSFFLLVVFWFLKFRCFFFLFFFSMISFITTKKNHDKRKKGKKKGSGYHNSLDWLRKWNVSWKGEKVANTDVRFTAEIYPLTIDFSVSSFSLDGWSQKLLISPPNSSSVVTLKSKGLDSLRYQAIEHRQTGGRGAQGHHVSGSWLMSLNLVSFRMILIRSKDSAWRIRSSWTC